jgi:hypothetical protein
VQLPFLSFAMTYFSIVVALSIIAIVNVVLVVYAYMRTKNRQPRWRDHLLGFLLAGPFFFIIDRELRRREHKLTSFEYFGLLSIALVVLIIIVGSIVTNFSKYPF